MWYHHEMWKETVTVFQQRQNTCERLWGAVILTDGASCQEHLKLCFSCSLCWEAEMHVGWAHYWSRWWNPGQREKESCHGAPPFSISSQGMKSECVRLKLSLESTHSKSSSELSDDQRVKLSVMQARFLATSILPVHFHYDFHFPKNNMMIT